MSRGTTVGILIALIVAHIAFAASFASITPYRTAGFLAGVRDPKTGGPQRIIDVGAPDERQHVNYIARLVHSGGFPVFDPKDPNLGETYQSHQPPLFYLLASGWSVVTGIDIPPAPPATEGKEMTQEDGVKLRALNVIIGATTVGGVFMLALWGYRRPEVAIAAAAFAALLPMNVALSGAVSNDPLLYCLCTWCLALLVHGIRDGWTTKLAEGVGIMAGLAILTKTTGVALLPVILLGVMMKGEHRVTRTQFIAAAASILVLVLPWWIRNQSLYGDPFAMKAFNQAFPGSAQASTFIEDGGALFYWKDMFFTWSAHSFVGVFGYMDIWLTNTTTRSGTEGIYQIVWLLLMAAGIGWLMGMRKREPGEGKIHLLNGAFAAIVVLLFISFNAKYFQAQSRYVFPAIGPIACAVAFGLVSLVQKRPYAMVVALVLVLGLADGFALSKLPEAFQLRTNMMLGR